MNRARVVMITAILGCVGASQAATPVPPSYQRIESQAAQLRQELNRTPNAPATPGWIAFLDAVDRDLKAYTAAGTESQRVAALERLNQMATSLRGVAWNPLAGVSAELDNWLRPRRYVAQTAQWVKELVQKLPATSDPNLQANRQKWLDFVEKDLGAALQAYEVAANTTERLAAQERIQHEFDELTRINQTTPWQPAVQLRQALASLFDRPNLEASADLPTIRPFFEADVAITGTIQRRGQTSYVTAGQKTGFSLLPSDNGIAFSNSQMLTSYTPIQGFQQQLEADPQGQRAARMYNFCAATQDYSQMTVTTWLRPSGIDLAMSPTHNVQFLVNAVPQAGGGLGRAIAGLIGMTREAIIERVRSEGYPRVTAEVAQGAQEEANDRAAVRRTQENARLAKYLVGNDTLAIGPVNVSGLDLRSRPEFAFIRGTVEWRGMGDQLGADTPKPAKFQRIAPGITADLHLPSVLTNMARGEFETPQIKNVSSLMIVTQANAASGAAPNPNPTPGTPPKIVTNADYAAFLAANPAPQDPNGPRAMAVRISKPSRPPVFFVDANGNLVVQVQDVNFDVPAPARRGLVGDPNVRAYRLATKQAEFAVSFHLEPAPVGSTTAKVVGKIEAFDPGPGAHVIDLGAEESSAKEMNALASAVALGVIRALVQGQPFAVPIDESTMKGIHIRALSPLDPSGWLRAELERTGPATAPVATTVPGASPAQVAQSR